MKTVSWPTDGAAFETLVAVLLSRRFKHAVRMRPGRGDGGVDVFVPLDDGLVDVYQVKAYADSLDSGRKSKIEDSLKRAATNGSIRIHEWYLVLPLDPTPPLTEWF